MKRFGRDLLTHLLLLLLLLGLGLPATPTLGAQGLTDYLPGEVTVKLRQAADLAGVAADFGLDPSPIAQFGSRPIYRLHILDATLPPDKAASLTSDSRVIFAEPNYLQQTPEGRQRYSWASGGSGGEFVGQWAATKIRLPQAHAVTRGAGVTVAVLDTGVDPTHPQLAGRLIAGYDFVDMDADPREEGAQGANLTFGHGTHVAGLVALAAPEAQIMPVRVLDADGIGNLWVLAEALAYAVNPDGDPTTDDGADVINLSLSTPRRTALLEEIVAAVTCAADDDGDDDDGDDDDGDDDDGDDDDGDADDGDADDGDDDTDCLARVQRGAVVTAAAGNNSGQQPEYPAGEGTAGLLAVAASTSADRLATFSNYGAWVQVAAPGDQIMSSVPDGGYGVWNGTSMAAPLTAGVAALVRAAQPTFNAQESANQVMRSAVPLHNARLRRIDAAAAVGVARATDAATYQLFLPAITR